MSRYNSFPTAHAEAVRRFKNSPFHRPVESRTSSPYDSGTWGKNGGRRTSLKRSEPSRSIEGMDDLLPQDYIGNMPQQSEPFSASSHHNGGWDLPIDENNEPKWKTDSTWNGYSNGESRAERTSPELPWTPAKSEHDFPQRSDVNVKFAPATEGFEKLRSQAMELWTSGVDLELDKEEKKKVKKGWLTELEFQNFQPEDKSRKTSNDFSNGESGNSHTQTHARSFAEVVASSQPSSKPSSGWSPEAEVTTTASNWNSSAQVVMPTENFREVPYINTARQLSGQPMFQSPTAATGLYSIYTQFNGMQPIASFPGSSGAAGFSDATVWGYDLEVYRFLHAIEKNLYKSKTISTFRSRQEFLLQQSPKFSFRTYSMLIEALIHVINQEQMMDPQPDGYIDANGMDQSTAKTLRTYISSFMSTFQMYLRAYVATPRELLPALRLFSLIVGLYPDIAAIIPLPLIKEHYNLIKPIFNKQETKEAEDHIARLTPVQHTEQRTRSNGNRLLQTGELEESWQNTGNDNTWDNDYSQPSTPLPVLPTGENILHDVLRDPENDVDTRNRERRQKWQENCKAGLSANVAGSSYQNLASYLQNYYMLLWEEVCGPLHLALRNYLMNQCSCDIRKDEGWAIYPNMRPFGTALLSTANEPTVFMETITSSNIGELPLEGSMALLIPAAKDNSVNQRKHLASVASSAVLGAVLYSAKFYDKPLSIVMGIHLEQQHLDNFDWSQEYTVITTGVNASSSLSVLRWFYTNTTQLEDWNFSQVTVTRLLSPDQKKPDHGQRGFETDDVPDYLQNIELDISCIMSQKMKGSVASLSAKDPDKRWPRHTEEQLAIPPSHRPPLYTLSPSQIKAVQNALTNRVSAISGEEGTGKTHLTSKLVELIHQGLIAGQCYHPILLLTQNEETLDDILDRIAANGLGFVRVGNYTENERLQSRHIVSLATPSPSDPNRKIVQITEKSLANIQAHLTALWHYRWRLEERDPRVMVTAIPPQYASELKQGYVQVAKEFAWDVSLEKIWDRWVSGDTDNMHDDNNRYHPRQTKNGIDRIRRLDAIFQSLGRAPTSNYGSKTLPLFTRQWFKERRNWIDRHIPEIVPLVQATNWPFHTSHSAQEVRKAVMSKWAAETSPNRVWSIPVAARKRLQQSIADVLLEYIDAEIKRLLTKQAQASKVVEDARQQKWLSICRFNRIIGMTAEYAAANHDMIAALWPRIVIMEEAESILEPIVAPILFNPRVEHIIMLGNAVTEQKPTVNNAALRGEPRNLDISLFERWKSTGGDIIRLEEQWRMCADIARIHDSLARPSANKRLLITAPMASENVADRSAPALLGLSCRAFFIDYQENEEKAVDHEFSKALHTELTKTDVDEARFSCHLALYLLQQGYKPSKISILTLIPLQKELIRLVMKLHIPKQTGFSAGTDQIIIDEVDKRVGKEDWFVILSLSAAMNKTLPNCNLSLALSRARYGLYIVGRRNVVEGSVWDIVAKYMKSQDMCAPEIELQCQKHKECKASVGRWEDFKKVKNGGCEKPCRTLLECGHVCQETCHHMNHDNVKCLKKCDRPRPSGCSHACPNMCYECGSGQCPPCQKLRTLQLPCGHTISGFCHSLTAETGRQCKQVTAFTLPCGHTQRLECYRTRSQEKERIKCIESVSTTLECGHTVITPCGYKPVCLEPCGKPLECGHPCPKKCGSDHRTHTRKHCTASCPKQLICGHYCAKGCANPEDHTERCLEPCQSVCSHGYRCGRACYLVCNKCMNPCPYSCIHLACTKKCFEKCDRPPCNKSCGKRLECSHPCPGLCGEPCPPCKICNPELRCTISLRSLSEFEESEKVYMLPECGCVFSVESLDMYFRNQAKSGEHTAIKLWQCPSCQKPIYTALRYNMYIKTEIALVNDIKAGQELARQRISQREKSDIIQAMNEEARMGIHNIVGGRWFVCPNGHPYYIGECGGATELSKCPQCGAIIGGLQHRVVESNRFYGEFDGSFAPAWPGQPK